MISIRNWTGQANVDSGLAANDRLIFISNAVFTDAQLAGIQFYGDNGSPFATGAHQISFSGYTELVPVPEPTTVFGALALLGLAGWRERRRIAGLCKRLNGAS